MEPINWPLYLANANNYIEISTVCFSILFVAIKKEKTLNINSYFK